VLSPKFEFRVVGPTIRILKPVGEPRQALRMQPAHRVTVVRPAGRTPDACASSPRLQPVDPCRLTFPCLGVGRVDRAWPLAPVA
jgi:hypothetical protein